MLKVTVTFTYGSPVTLSQRFATESDAIAFMTAYRRATPFVLSWSLN